MGVGRGGVHSGTFGGTFGVHSGYIRVHSGVHSGYILGAFGYIRVQSAGFRGEGVLEGSRVWCLPFLVPGDPGGGLEVNIWDPPADPAPSRSDDGM